MKFLGVSLALLLLVAGCLPASYVSRKTIATKSPVAAAKVVVQKPPHAHFEVSKGNRFEVLGHSKFAVTTNSFVMHEVAKAVSARDSQGLQNITDTHFTEVKRRVVLVVWETHKADSFCNISYVECRAEYEGDSIKVYALLYDFDNHNLKRI